MPDAAHAPAPLPTEVERRWLARLTDPVMGSTVIEQGYLAPPAVATRIEEGPSGRRLVARHHATATSVIAPLPEPEGEQLARLLDTAPEARRPAVRVRRQGTAWWLTAKGGVGLARPEVEAPLAEADGAALLDLVGPRRLRKGRTTVPIGDDPRLSAWEVDQFDGPLRGLVIVELEIRWPGASERELLSMPLPPTPPGVLLGPEITGRADLSNSALAALSPDEARALVRSLTLPPAVRQR